MQVSCIIMDADAVVIGAGSTGLAVLRALGPKAVGVERGSNVGGLWRYENDNGLSSAYASLRTNVSRSRMQYPSFPMPETFEDFPHHTEMAAYLDYYADAFGLRERISFGVAVERLERRPDGGWLVTLDDGSALRARAAVVATGHDWCPRLPEYPGGFDGEVLHAHDYRTPEPFAGRRVLVVGAGQSAAEIAVELTGHAARTCLSIRSPVHVIPRRLGGTPYDARDTWPANRLPWPLLNRLFAREVGRELGPLPAASPAGARSSSTRSSTRPATGSACPSSHRTCSRLRGAGCRSTGASCRPGSTGCSSPASSMPRAGCCRSWRRRATGSPRCSKDGSRYRAPPRCAVRSSAPSGAAACGSRASRGTASAATRTPIGACCSPTCGGRTAARGPTARRRSGRCGGRP